MGREIASNCFDFTMKKIGLFTFGAFLIIQGALGQRVKVETEVVSYPGQTVTLSCQFVNAAETKLTQVSWIWEQTGGKRDNIAVFHPQFGASYPTSQLTGRVRFTNASLHNPSITITDVKMSDGGKFTCEYATYPTGNEQGTTTLVMLAKPKNSASVVTVTAGTAPVVVARCESANGRPAAEVTWVTTVNGNETTLSKPGTEDTVTVSSEYKLIPTPADNGKDISCVVSHRTEGKPQSFQMKLEIEYPPEVTIVGYDNNWHRGRTNAVLTCRATGNPMPSTFTWKALSGLMPDTVLVKENTLTVLEVDEAVNTTFACEVQNRLGVGKAQVMAVVREPPVNSSNTGVVVGAVIGSILAIALVAGLIAVLWNRKRRQLPGYRGNPNQGTYDIKTRVFGGKKASKNGAGANNNGPIYTYRESDSGTLTEKSNNIHRGEGLVAVTPTATDILLSGEMDEAERRKFDELDEDEERYDHFGGGEPILQIRPHDEEGGAYLGDDMESQRDGSVISRTAVYV